MKKRFLTSISLLIILLFCITPVWGVMETETVEDDLSDGLDWLVFYNDDIQIPAPLIFDAVEAGVSLDDSTLNFQIGFSEPVPEVVPYSLQIAIDSNCQP